MISVLILTRNEAKEIEECLRSVSWSDDVHVFDSQSTDDTKELASRAGARISERTFDDYSSQRNAALRGLDFKYAWVLMLDADERVPEALSQQLRVFVQTAPASVSACRLRRRDFFMGRWLKHAAISPYFVRLVKPQKVYFFRAINEVLQVDGDIHDLSEPFDHYPFSKGLSHWIAKHNTYSTLEAELIVASSESISRISIPKSFFSRDFNERRFHQKQLFYKLPARPLIKWLYMMFIRGAFLDGRPGVVYARLQRWYEYMIVFKTRELRGGGRS